MNDESLQRECELIGARIRKARVEQKMSQSELALKANISLPHISSIELGKTHMSLATFIKIIEVLQISADSVIRAYVPTVTEIYMTEISDLFKDCTPDELEALKSIIKSIKATMRNNQNKG